MNYAFCFNSRTLIVNPSWYYSGSWLLTPWLIRPACWWMQPTLASARPTLSVTWVLTKASPGTSSPNPSWALSLVVQNQEQRFQWCWPPIQTWKVCETTSFPKLLYSWSIARCIAIYLWYQTLGWNILPRPPHVEKNVLNLYSLFHVSPVWVF